MTTPISINPTQAAILGLLHEDPLTGGQTMATAEKWMNLYWNMTRSQVYRELQALATWGYLKEGKAGSRNSIPFKITNKGKQALYTWLSEPVGTDHIRNQIALRIALSGLQETERVESMILEMKQRHKSLLKEAKTKVKEAEAQGLTWDALALGFSVAYHKAVLDWLGTIDPSKANNA